MRRSAIRQMRSREAFHGCPPAYLRHRRMKRWASTGLVRPMKARYWERRNTAAVQADKRQPFRLAGEALTGARTGRAIEHRKRERLERRDCHSGRRQHRHHRNGEGMAGSTVSENPCTFVRPSSGPGRSSFCPGSRTGAAAGRRIPYPMMHGMKKSDEAIVPVKAANKGAQTPAESPEGRASTKGNLRDQSTHRTQGRDGVSQAVERIRQAATPRGLPSTTQGRSRMR